MRLVSFDAAPNMTCLGVMVEGGVVNLSAADPNLGTDMIRVIEQGASGLDKIRQIVAASRPQLLKAGSLRAPILRPPEFLGVGLNYSDHAQEAGMDIPLHPLIFNKQSSCVCGCEYPIEMPRDSEQLDYEGELGLVIGHAGRYMSREQAATAIYGYVIVNDISVRDWQLRSPTHTLGKSFDTHGPTGPWLVTADEVPDPQKLTITTRVNKEVRQHGNTANMIFDCVSIVALLSQVMTLAPGTLVTTGTPAGVGLCRRPPSFMRAGDVVSVEITGLGCLTNPVVSAPGDQSARHSQQSDRTE